MSWDLTPWGHTMGGRDQLDLGPGPYMADSATMKTVHFPTPIFPLWHTFAAGLLHFSAQFQLFHLQKLRSERQHIQLVYFEGDKRAFWAKMACQTKTWILWIAMYTIRSFRDFYVGHGGPCCTNFCHFYFIFIFSAEWNSAMRTFENGQRKCHFFPINKVEFYSQLQLLFPRDLCFVAGKDVLFTLLDNFDECKCICVLLFDKSIEILNSLLFGLWV